MPKWWNGRHCGFKIRCIEICVRVQVPPSALYVHTQMVRFMKISRKDYWKIPYAQLNGIYEIEDYGIFHLQNGKLHRLDGPAIEWYDGTKDYFIEGKEYSSKDEFDKVVYLYPPEHVKLLCGEHLR